ncbi:hypothetical protein DFH06DRAFT_1172665 [Mycena polygramma]|nr:hypothetical protein DFH06DRAFT_1172665 [Mycena polygramma]
MTALLSDPDDPPPCCPVFLDSESVDDVARPLLVPASTSTLNLLTPASPNSDLLGGAGSSALCPPGLGGAASPPSSPPTQLRVVRRERPHVAFGDRSLLGDAPSRVRLACPPKSRACAFPDPGTLRGAALSPSGLAPLAPRRRRLLLARLPALPVPHLERRLGLRLGRMPTPESDPADASRRARASTFLSLLSAIRLSAEEEGGGKASTRHLI